MCAAGTLLYGCLFAEAVSGYFAGYFFKIAGDGRAWHLYRSIWYRWTPFERRNLTEVIGKAVADGMIIAVGSQCLYEGSDFTVYEVGAPGARTRG